MVDPVTECGYRHGSHILPIQATVISCLVLSLFYYLPHIFLNLDSTFTSLAIHFPISLLYQLSTLSFYIPITSYATNLSIYLYAPSFLNPIAQTTHYYFPCSANGFPPLNLLTI